MHHSGQPGNPSQHARQIPLLPYPTPSPDKFDAMLQRASQNFERDLQGVKTLIRERTDPDTLKAIIKQSTNLDVLEAKIDELGLGFEKLLEFSKVQMESSQLQRGLNGMCDQQALDEESNVPPMQGLGSMPMLEETRESAVNVVGASKIKLQDRKTKSRGDRIVAAYQPTPSRVTRSRAKQQPRTRKPGSRRA